MKKIIIFLIAVFFFSLNYTITNAQDNIIIFYSNSCGYCKDLFEAIEEEKIDEILEIQRIEASEEGFQEIFTQSLEECDLDPNKGGYPTLYHNGECSVGSLNAINTLFELAGIEKNEDVIESETENQIAETEEDRTLSEVDETEDFEIPKRPFWQILAMLVGPAILVGIAYFMIKKLNL
jgi:hypothetical protein